MLRKSCMQAQMLLCSVQRQTRAMTTIKKSKKQPEKENIAKWKKISKPGLEFSLATEEPLNAHYLTRHLGGFYRQWAAVLEKHPELKTVKRKDLNNSYNKLISLNYTVDDIITKPMIIYFNASTLSNRHSVLLECGFKDINISTLFKYVTISNKPIAMLKSQFYIPYDVDVGKCLAACFTDIDISQHLSKTANENITLKALRQHLLNEYLRQRLEMTESDLQKLWRTYSRVRHKNFRAVQDVIEVITKDLQFPIERIRKNSFLLHADADNVRRIVKEIPKIDVHDMREIVYRRPKILMTTCDSLKQTLEHVRNFGISEDAVLRCLEVLTLGPDTVLDRLRDLNEIEEFQVLGSNPRVLRLVHYQNKARLRLDYLNQLKVRCASLHILSCGSEAFAKFARDGSDRTKGRDIVVFLGNILEKDEQELRNLLSRHPHWCHIPLLHVKQCLEYLSSRKFAHNDIFQNIHLLLYPIKRIEEKLQLLQDPDYFEELNLEVSDVHKLSSNEILTLILYLIESEFHFTGDGIWTDQHAHHVENFNNLLPDFPESLNKVYKYGVKPAEKLAMHHF